MAVPTSSLVASRAPIVSVVRDDRDSFKMFPIDVGARDFHPDLVDDWISLGLENSTLPDSWASFHGSTEANPACLEIDYCE